MRRALAAIMFFPRGGSAHAARDLAQWLPDHGWEETIVSGTRRDLGPGADAHSFYRDLDVEVVDFTDALRDPHPLRFGGEGRAPMHPSYEDRPDAPDRVFAGLDDFEFELQVRAWSEALDRARARSFDLLHLHHLTPINEAAARVAPEVPVVGQLHGTELLMLECVAAGPPPSWRHAERWAERVREWAAACRFLIVAPGGIERAESLLEVPHERLIAVPSGFDPNRFHRMSNGDRLSFWRQHLVEQPQGWLPGGDPGSIGYAESDLSSFADGVVLMFVGRFTEVKRVPVLLRAYAQAKDHFRRPAPLVLVGGYPGEWEGEHPSDVISEIGVKDVFLAGWRKRDVLPSFLAAADVIVLPSVREQFGQALVEGMACGLPAIAARSIGAEGIIDDGCTGWIVPGDDTDSMAAALVSAVNNDAERRSRGHEARRAMLSRYAWPEIAGRVAEVFDAACDGRASHTKPTREGALD